MNCAEIGGLLDLLMDDALTDEQRRELEAHGRECPACAEAIRATTQMKALFAGMDDEADVPLEAQARWRGAVRAEAARNRRRRSIRWIASAAAAVVAVAGIGLALNSRNAPETGAKLMAVEESAELAEADAAAYDDGAREAAVAADSANATANFVAADSTGEVSNYKDADSAVVEADGAAEVEVLVADDEEDGMVALDGEEPLYYAASASRSPACELTLRVDDVDTACDRVRDLVEEYEGEADVQALEDGGANLYIEIDAANAGDFLSAVLPMDVSDGQIEPPEIPDEGVLLLLLTVVG